MTTYRPLADKEIATLTVYGCSAENWKNVLVAEDFSPAFISNVHFSGTIHLGSYNIVFEIANGVKKHSGIYNCLLHNCIVKNDVFIDRVHNYIANYEIGEGTYIENVDLIAVEGVSSFGNGVKVPIMNEGGGREIPIFDSLSAPLAYMLALYRYRPELIRSLQDLIEQYSIKQQSDKGSIGKNVRIVNCGSLKNIRIGDSAILEGTTILENGTINSNEQAPVKLGFGVKCYNFIIGSGSSITDSTTVSGCFVGQGCVLGNNFSALDSVFFANSQGLLGEAASIFAGPYTVTHHKSSMLLAGMFSFFNAGSGTNQSNHMYKLGPIHQGVTERGVKTSSDSYLSWPAKIGAFTFVMGRHTKHSDTSELPFSYLIENNTDSFLIPAINLQSAGTIRDAQKWPKRDFRTDSHKLDPINFNLLNPYSIQKIMKGVEVLKNIQDASNGNSDVFSYKNCKIKKAFLLKGIDLYNTAIIKFLGNSLISRLKDAEFKSINEIHQLLKSETDKGSGEWIDLSGLIAPKDDIDRLMVSIENKSAGLEDIQLQFENIHTNYDKLAWTWASQKLEEYWGKPIDKIGADDLTAIIELWKASVVKLDQLIYSDARKEFDQSSKVGFGIDGNEEQKQQDFESVRGNFENNAFVQGVLNHIKIKTELGDELINRLSKINQ
ncbi:MAG: DUF4954 family protein [Bacteroidota bacterium]|nr:DUF4954 family protein [Bacteroidota bacterium]